MLFQDELPPANPIMTRADNPPPPFRILPLLRSPPQPTFLQRTKKVTTESDQDEEDIKLTIEQYQTSKESLLVYRRFDNSKNQVAFRVKYFSGCFINSKCYEQTNNIFRTCLGGPSRKISEKSLFFDSDFQSGNLFAAYRISQYEYDLILQNDTNSKGYTQWFYFKIGNNRRAIYTFRILNFFKASSLYQHGLKVLAKFGQEQNWIRVGSNYVYQHGDILIQGTNRRFYSYLSFELRLQKEYESIYLAHSFPYTTKRLQSFIKKVCQTQRPYLKLQKQVVGFSLLHQPIYMLKIFKGSLKKQSSTQEKNYVVLMGRQHPGQTQGSFMIQGALQFLTSGSVEAQNLLERNNFVIFPMMNPDGVRHGNYRCNIAGRDLNRSWGGPFRTDSHPQTSCVQRQISKLNVQFFLDFHGHSKKMGAFFFNNPSPRIPQEAMVIPYIASNINLAFDFSSCTYSIEQQKRTTARIVLSQGGKAPGIYSTLQASFFGFIKDGKKCFFSQQDLKKLGKDSLLAYSRKVMQVDRFALKRKNILQIIKKKLKDSVFTNVNSDSQAELQFFNQKQFNRLQESCDCPPQPTANLGSTKISFISRSKKSKKKRNQSSRQFSHQEVQTEISGVDKIIIKQFSPVRNRKLSLNSTFHSTTLDVQLNDFSQNLKVTGTRFWNNKICKYTQTQRQRNQLPKKMMTIRLRSKSRPLYEIDKQKPILQIRRIDSWKQLAQLNATTRSRRQISILY